MKNADRYSKTEKSYITLTLSDKWNEYKKFWTW